MTIEQLLAELEAKLAARRERKMGDYKVVPVEPVSHDRDDQDKCRRCGDRDWYASATCTPKQYPAEHHIADETPARTSFGGPQRFATAEQQPAPGMDVLVEARKVVALPITTEVGGQEWHLYTYDYATQDGLFSGYLYALDMGHAEQLLSEMKSTAVLAGQMIEAIDAAPQAGTPC